MTSIQKMFATLEYIKNKLNAFSFTTDELIPVETELQQLKDLIEYCNEIEASANNLKIELKDIIKIYKDSNLD